MRCIIYALTQTTSTFSVIQKARFLFDLHQENGVTHFFKILLKYWISSRLWGVIKHQKLVINLWKKDARKCIYICPVYWSNTCSQLQNIPLMPFFFCTKNPMSGTKNTATETHTFEFSIWANSENTYGKDKFFIFHQPFEISVN